MTWAVSRSRWRKKQSCNATGAREQKVVSRRDMLIPAGLFQTKVAKEGATSREREIKQQEAARQTKENTMRIAQMCDLALSNMLLFKFPLWF